ncbi:MAG TPA: glyoxalase superfamily protein [Coleofasciculaceae cyanobacterium]
MASSTQLTQYAQLMNNPPVLGNISPLIPAGDDVEKAIAFYEQQLGFTTIHKEGNPIKMAIVKRDVAEIFLVKNDYIQLPEGISIRIQVNGIEQLYQEFQSKGGGMIHPNGQLETKPWGLKEMVVIAPSSVCITFCEPEK